MFLYDSAARTAVRAAEFFCTDKFTCAYTGYKFSHNDRCQKPTDIGRLARFQYSHLDVTSCFQFVTYL
jgi:hypothetical protein